MTSRIALLSPETVANISAGEVIERPASVVKELIENALDAGATRIRIELQGAGLKLIRVSDNGSGIAPDNAVVAFSRHTTSKLTALEDLLHIQTFGFRGEALAAIAAAGEVDMTTRIAGSAEGVRVTGDGGAALEVRPAGCEIGTTVAIKNLFSAMPARMKFLKNPSAETAAVLRVLEPYVLAHHNIHFVLTVNGEERLNAPPGSDRLARVRAILGAGDIQLLPFQLSGEGVTAHGFVESPGSVRRRGRQWLQVNRRPVEDRALRHAVIASYEGQLPRDTQPYAVLFIDLPADQIDVNVHPTKAEIRFANPQLVYRILYRALQQAFGTLSGSQPLPGHATVPLGTPAGKTDGSPSSAPAVAGEPLAPWVTGGAASGEAPQILGQLFQTYIVARHREGLLLVDQHTAHERVIYERLQDRERSQVAQVLLIPQTIEFSPSEYSLLTTHTDELKQLGIEYDIFGGQSIVLRAVPPEAQDRDLPVLLRWLLEDLEEVGRAPSPGVIAKRMLSTMACHLAVKAGDRLDRSVMERIVCELLVMRDPRSCPHGRPTFVQYDEGELAKMFRRTWGLGKRECH